MSKKKLADALQGVILPAKRPDLDNYVKMVLDACESVVYIDDKQVVRLRASKVYGETPGIEVTFIEIGT